MKLSTLQKARAEAEFGTQALADDHRAIERLKDAFGDHTFFLDASGLKIVDQAPDGPAETGSVIRLASWAENRKDLQAHKPELLPVTIDLSGDASGSEM